MHPPGPSPGAPFPVGSSSGTQCAAPHSGTGHAVNYFAIRGTRLHESRSALSWSALAPAPSAPHYALYQLVLAPLAAENLSFPCVARTVPPSPGSDTVRITSTLYSLLALLVRIEVVDGLRPLVHPVALQLPRQHQLRRRVDVPLPQRPLLAQAQVVLGQGADAP